VLRSSLGDGASVSSRMLSAMYWTTHFFLPCDPGALHGWLMMAVSGFRCSGCVPARSRHHFGSTVCRWNTCLDFCGPEMILGAVLSISKLRRLFTVLGVKFVFGSGDHHWSAPMRFRASGTFGVIINQSSLCLSSPRAVDGTSGGGGFDLFLQTDPGQSGFHPKSDVERP